MWRALAGYFSVLLSYLASLPSVCVCVSLSTMSSKPLSLSLKKKKRPFVAAPSLNQRGIYDLAARNFPLPPGFKNSRNCCYANSVFQCLMNSTTLQLVLNTYMNLHPEQCNERVAGMKNRISVDSR